MCARCVREWPLPWGDVRPLHLRCSKKSRPVVLLSTGSRAGMGATARAVSPSHSLVSVADALVAHPARHDEGSLACRQLGVLRLLTRLALLRQESLWGLASRPRPKGGDEITNVSAACVMPRGMLEIKAHP